MTGVQIAMSREFFGWPLYALVMGTGQVRQYLWYIFRPP